MLGPGSQRYRAWSADPNSNMEECLTADSQRQTNILSLGGLPSLLARRTAICASNISESIS